MNTSNLSYILNKTEQFGFLTSVGNLTNSTLKKKENDPSPGYYIFLYLLLALFLIAVCSCFYLFLYIIFKYFRNISINNQHRNTRNMSYDFFNDSEIDIENGEENNILQKSNINIKKLIMETPLDEIVFPKNDENFVVSIISCAICLEEINLLDKSKVKVVQLSCKHIYHQECISKWYFGNISSIKKCPLCRKEIDQHINHIYSI